MLHDLNLSSPRFARRGGSAHALRAAQAAAAPERATRALPRRRGLAQRSGMSAAALVRAGAAAPALRGRAGLRSLPQAEQARLEVLISSREHRSFAPLGLGPGYGR